MKGALNLFFTISCFLSITYNASGCDQEYLDSEGKKLVSPSQILKFNVDSSSLIMLMKVKDFEGNLISFEIQKVLKGYFPGKVLKTDAFQKSADKKFSSKDLLPRTAVYPDCSIDKSSIGVMQNHVYIYFAGNKNFILEDVTIKNNLLLLEVEKALK